MAGKELKATEKTVLKHSRDGVLEQNLANGSAKKVSKKAEEAVLKTEGVALAAEYQIHVAPVRLIKLKAAVFLDKFNELFFKHGVHHSCISASSSASDLAESSPSA